MAKRSLALSLFFLIIAAYSSRVSRAANAPVSQQPQAGDYFANDSGFTPPCDEAKFTPLHREDAPAYCECVRDNRIANENWKYSHTPPMARDEIRHRGLLADFEALCAQNNHPVFELGTETNVYNSPPPGPHPYPTPRQLPPQAPVRPRNSPRAGRITNDANPAFKLIAREPGCIYTGMKKFQLNNRIEDVEVCLAQHKSRQRIVLNLQPFHGGTGIVRLEGTFIIYPGGNFVLNVTNLGGTALHNGSTIPLCDKRVRDC